MRCDADWGGALFNGRCPGCWMASRASMGGMSLWRIHWLEFFVRHANHLSKQSHKMICTMAVWRQTKSVLKMSSARTRSTCQLMCDSHIVRTFTHWFRNAHTLRIQNRIRFRKWIDSKLTLEFWINKVHCRWIATANTFLNCPFLELTHFQWSMIASLRVISKLIAACHHFNFQWHFNPVPNEGEINAISVFEESDAIKSPDETNWGGFNAVSSGVEAERLSNAWPK